MRKSASNSIPNDIVLDNCKFKAFAAAKNNCDLTHTHTHTHTHTQRERERERERERGF